MSIRGMDGVQAGRLLAQCFSRFRNAEVSRAQLFREVVHICWQCAATADGNLHGLGDIDVPGDPAFKRLPGMFARPSI